MSSSTTEFEARLQAARMAVEACMSAHLAALDADPGRSPRLVAAMRHATLNGGKRLRPFLVFTSAGLFDMAPAVVAPVAAALEFIHCYSLVHDDLPAMDNDDLRRGQPTVHRAFDEATAILAGDALLGEAFALVAGAAGLAEAPRLRLVAALAEAAGPCGMVGGQMLDLAAEGRFDGTVPRLDAAAIRLLQGRKTGALLRFACQAGVLMQDGPEVTAGAALTRFGEAFGLAFQLKDDLLDEEGDAAVVGKATGKDREAGKGTLVSLLGLAEARRMMRTISGQAEMALSGFGRAADPFRALLAYNEARAS